MQWLHDKSMQLCKFFFRVLEPRQKSGSKNTSRQEKKNAKTKHKKNNRFQLNPQHLGYRGAALPEWIFP